MLPDQRLVQQHLTRPDRRRRDRRPIGQSLRRPRPRSRRRCRSWQRVWRGSPCCWGGKKGKMGFCKMKSLRVARRPDWRSAIRRLHCLGATRFAIAPRPTISSYGSAPWRRRKSRRNQRFEFITRAAAAVAASANQRVKSLCVGSNWSRKRSAAAKMSRASCDSGRNYVSNYELLRQCIQYDASAASIARIALRFVRVARHRTRYPA